MLIYIWFGSSHFMYIFHITKLRAHKTFRTSLKQFLNMYGHYFVKYGPLVIPYQIYQTRNIIIERTYLLTEQKYEKKLNI